MKKLFCYLLTFCLSFKLAFAEETDLVSFKSNVKLKYDNRSYSDDSSATNDDNYENNHLYVELAPNLNFKFSPKLSIISSWQMQLVKDPMDDVFFNDQGLLLEELYLNFEDQEAKFIFGKFNPIFGALWQDNYQNGIWGGIIAEQYKIVGKTGLGGMIKMDLLEYGQHEIQVTTFYNDTSSMSDSLLSKRDLSDNNIGLASDSDSLSSYNINLSGRNLEVLDNLSYNISYRFLKNPSDLNIEDESGFAITLAYEMQIFNKLKIKPSLEYTSIDAFNSFNNRFNQEFGDDAYLPADFESLLLILSINYNKWQFTYLFSDKEYDKLLSSENISVEDNEFSISYNFENNIELSIGTRDTDRDDINMSQKISTIQLFYKYELDN